MSPKKSALVLLVVFLAGCGGRSKMKRDQQQYDVVQEGSATGVTSTINAPGETPQPATTTAITGTNVDTTTAFTLPGTATATTTDQSGTIAGTLPGNGTGFPSGYTPRPRPRPVVTTTSTATPPPATQTAPTATDTVAPTTT